jgi:uncharacterized membrane protein YczE
MVENINPGTYFFQWLLCILSPFLVGFGVFCEVKSDVIMLPGEGIVSAISKVSGEEFAKMKICLDVTLVIIGIVISTVFMNELYGVREGTIAAAILVGITVKIYSRYIHAFDKLSLETKK